MHLRSTSSLAVRVYGITARNGNFRISNLLNPSNFGPESGSFIGFLSPKIFLAVIRHCVTMDACCSTWGDMWRFNSLVFVHIYTANIGHFVRNRRSFWKLGINLLLNSPQRYIHWTSEYATASMRNTIFARIIEIWKLHTISGSLIGTWRTWQIELYFARRECIMVLCAQAGEPAEHPH